MMNPYGRSDTYCASNDGRRKFRSTLARIWDQAQGAWANRGTRGQPTNPYRGGQKATAWDVGIRDAKLLEQALEERKKAGA